MNIEKVRDDLKKAAVLKNKFEILPASSLKHCFKFMMSAINKT